MNTSLPLSKMIFLSLTVRQMGSTLINRVTLCIYMHINLSYADFNRGLKLKSNKTCSLDFVSPKLRDNNTIINVFLLYKCCL